MIIKKWLPLVISLIALFSFGNLQAQSKPGNAMKKAAMERNAQNERNAQKDREKKQTSNNSSNREKSASSSSSNFSSESDTNPFNKLKNSSDYVKGTYEPGWHQFADGMGLVDSAGQLITPIYEDIELHNGLAIVKVDTTDDVSGLETYKYGIVNSFGQITAKPIYNKISTFPNHDQFLKIEIRDGHLNKCGLIDQTGRVLVKPVYDYIHEGNEVLFKVCNFDYGDLKWGLVENKFGSEILPPIYDGLLLQGSGLSTAGSTVIVWQKNDQFSKMALLDSTGKVIIAPNYDRIDNSDYKGCYLIINKNEKGKGSVYGLVTEKGQIITEPKFESEAMLYQYIKSKDFKLIPKYE